MNNSVSASTVLDEIQVDSLQQLLNSVHYETSPPGSTQIPALDHHILLDSPLGMLDASSLNRGDVLEVQGPAASGKTHLLYHLVINCVIPENISSIKFGGWNKVAIVLDTDGKWSSMRCRQLLVSRLSRQLSAHLDFANLASKALQNIHIFRPTSSLQLAATLMYLPVYHTTNLSHSEIGLLVIDSISTFYWADRFAVEQMRLIKTSGVLSPLNHVLTNLQRFRLSHAPVIILTNWGITPLLKSAITDNGGPLPYYKQHLHPFPAPLEQPPRNLSNSSLFPPITYHITLPFTATPSLPPDLTLDEAMKAETDRIEIVRQDDVHGVIRTVETGRVGRFSFVIGEHDISVSEAY